MKRIAENSRQALTEIAGNRTRNRLSPIPTQGNRTSVWCGAKKSCLHCREKVLEKESEEKSSQGSIPVTGMLGVEPSGCRRIPDITASESENGDLRRKANEVVKSRFPGVSAGFEPATSCFKQVLYR